VRGHGAQLRKARLYRLGTTLSGTQIATCHPAAAHHAFGSEFDANAPVLLKGKIVKIEWVNPHTWIHIETTKADGTKEVWMVEGGSPNTLLRRGANKNTSPEGTEIVVDGYQARDHSELRANARNVTFADGRKLFLGSTGRALRIRKTSTPARRRSKGSNLPLALNGRREATGQIYRHLRRNARSTARYATAARSTLWRPSGDSLLEPQRERSITVPIQSRFLSAESPPHRVSQDSRQDSLVSIKWMYKCRRTWRSRTLSHYQSLFAGVTSNAVMIAVQ
jgi:hypothetical protein